MDSLNLKLGNAEVQTTVKSTAAKLEAEIRRFTNHSSHGGCDSQTALHKHWAANQRRKGPGRGLVSCWRKARINVLTFGEVLAINSTSSDQQFDHRLLVPVAQSELLRLSDVDQPVFDSAGDPGLPGSLAQTERLKLVRGSDGYKLVASRVKLKPGNHWNFDWEPRSGKRHRLILNAKDWLRFAALNAAEDELTEASYRMTADGVPVSDWYKRRGTDLDYSDGLIPYAVVESGTDLLASSDLSFVRTEFFNQAMAGPVVLRAQGVTEIVSANADGSIELRVDGESVSVQLPLKAKLPPAGTVLGVGQPWCLLFSGLADSDDKILSPEQQVKAAMGAGDAEKAFYAWLQYQPQRLIGDDDDKRLFVPLSYVPLSVTPVELFLRIDLAYSKQLITSSAGENFLVLPAVQIRQTLQTAGGMVYKP